MKRVYILLGLCLVLCVCISLSACNGNKTTLKLDAPDTFSITGTVLSWQEVSNASDYIIRIGDDEYISTENNFNLSLMPTGVNRVQVRAKQHETDKYVFQQSDFGELLYIKKLDVVQNIGLHFDSLNWTAVSGANGYKINIINESQNVIYTTTLNTTSMLFSKFSNTLTSTNNFMVSIEAVAPTTKNTVQDGLMIFATINADANNIVFEVSNKLSLPSGIKLENNKNRIEWNNVANSNGCNVIIRNYSNDIVFTGSAQQDMYGYFLPVSQFENGLTTNGKYEFLIQAIVVKTPSWVLESNKAIYTTTNSDFAKFEITVDLNKKLSAVQNIRFWGETSYTTSIRWDTVVGASLYKIDLYDSENNLIYSEVSANEGSYLMDPFNPIIRNFVSSGQHTLSVKALFQENSPLRIYDEQIVRFNQDADCSNFNFTVNADAKLNSIQNIRIGTRYVGGEIQWTVPSGCIYPGGYLIMIQNDSGETVYTRSQNSGPDSDFLLANNFSNGLNKSGIYTIYIQCIAYPVIDYAILSKPQDSDIVEFVFYFNKDTGKISSIS